MQTRGARVTDCVTNLEAGADQRLAVAVALPKVGPHLRQDTGTAALFRDQTARDHPDPVVTKHEVDGMNCMFILVSLLVIGVDYAPSQANR
jgi:hypothetical protein